MESGKRHSEKLKFLLFPRLHLTLIGMNKGDYRINGGIGFAISKPNLELLISRSSSFAFVDSRQHKFDNEEIERIHSVIGKCISNNKFNHNICIEVHGNIRSHTGFGVSTSIRLACIEALYILNGAKYSNDQLVAESGRGGTSGIGINTYFDGGFVFDLGTKDKENQFSPSGFSEARKKVPLVLRKHPMPEWEIGLCMPINIRPRSENEELAFFKSTCPITDQSAYEILYHSVYGIYAAIVEHDKNVFCKAINALQECSWKKAETEIYGKPLKRMVKLLKVCGANTVGMSSLGPCLFFFSDDIDATIKKMESRTKEALLIKTVTWNKGRQLQYL